MTPQSATADTDELLPIGAISAATGVSVSALRHYDELGLIDAVTRIGGKRRFDHATIGRVNFVRRARGVGFSLPEIRDVLDRSGHEARDAVDAKISALRAQQDELATMISILEDVRTCGCDAVAECPRLDDL